MTRIQFRVRTLVAHQLGTLAIVAIALGYGCEFAGDDGPFVSETPTATSGACTDTLTKNLEKIYSNFENWNTGLQLVDFNLPEPSRTFRTPDFTALGLHAHVQGVTVARSWGGDVRVLFTQSGGHGLHLSTGSSLSQHFNELESASSLRITGLLEDAVGHKHPGGLQAQGDYVAIAMEQGYRILPNPLLYWPAPAAVYFVRLDGTSLTYLNRLNLDGSQGEPHQSENSSSAASAGFIRLADQHFLVAVAGASNGTQGIWFYRSETTDIETTTWKYRGFYEPPCVEQGPTDSCFTGASGLSLVASCDGGIFLVATNGTSEDDGKPGHGRATEYDMVQVYLLKSWGGGEVEMSLYAGEWAGHGDNQSARRSFRWGGGAFVDSLCRLNLINTERGHNDLDTDYTDGEVFVGRKTWESD